MATPPAKPMSSQPRETLLKFLDPNLRFKLANRCPSIRQIEKSIPLTIDTLKFDDTTVTVNNTVYQLRLFNVYVNFDEAPPNVTTETVAHDMNSGSGQLEDFSHVTKPGDIDLRTNVERRECDQEMEEERRHEEMFEISLEYSGMRLSDLQMQQELDNSEETRNRILELRMENAGLRRLQTRDRRDRTRRNQARLNRDRVIPAGELQQPYIKLIIESGGPEYSEEMYYHKKLYRAVKYFNKKLFGGRKDIRVKKFVLEKFGVYRFPVHFKVEVVNEMEFGGTFDFEKLDNIISVDNYASTTVTINLGENDDANWDQQAIRTAKMLKIQDHTDNISDVLQKLENKDVMYFQRTAGHYNNLVTQLIRHWRKNGKPVGTKYMIGHSDLKSVQKTLNSVKHTFKIERNQHRAVILSMKKWNTKLRVLWERALPVQEDNCYPYLLTLKVEYAS